MVDETLKFYQCSDSPTVGAIECTEKQFQAWARRTWYRFRDEVREAGLERKIDEAENDLDVPAVASDAKRRLEILTLWKMSGETAARYRFMAGMYGVWVRREEGGES